MSVIRTVFVAACLAIAACGQASGGGAKPSAAPVAIQQTSDASSSRAHSDESAVTASCGGGVTGARAASP